MYCKKFHFALCLLLLNWGTTHRGAVAVQETDLEQLISAIDATRANFDKFYFEFDLVTKYDEVALEKGWGDANMRLVQKIARDGEKRFLKGKIIPMPEAKIRYSTFWTTAVYDGESSRIHEGVAIYVDDEKSPDCERNLVFYAFGWPEGNELIPNERVYVPQILRDPKGNWSVTDVMLNDRECYQASSDEFGMQFWFDKESKMPLKYTFKQSEFCPYNKVVEFLNYAELNESGVTFPAKIVVACELFSDDGENHGRSTVTIDISNCSLEPDPDLFILKPGPDDIVVDLKK